MAPLRGAIGIEIVIFVEVFGKFLVILKSAKTWCLPIFFGNFEILQKKNYVLWGDGYYNTRVLSCFLVVQTWK